MTNMTKNLILRRIRKQDDSVIPEIEELSLDERKQIRLELDDDIPRPRILSFDYKTQQWF